MSISEVTLAVGRTDLQRLFAPDRSATVHVVQLSIPFGPITVSSTDAMPRRQHYRYRQHVGWLDVVAVVRQWLEDLPAGFCTDNRCDDERRWWWDELRTRLAQVDCIEVQQHA